MQPKTEVALCPKRTDSLTFEMAQLASIATTALDLHRSSLEDLQLARIYTRHQNQVCLRTGYCSDDDKSDDDEAEGRLFTEKHYHDNGQPKYFRTYQILPAKGNLQRAERLVEEKHFDVGGVCCLDIHFALGQPYLSRKHFHWNQRLKSEKLFFVEDDRTMVCRKAGHWREYYEGGQIKSEIVYDANGMRTGFCKRYAEDGTVEWVKDYTKEQGERIAEFNAKRGNLAFSVEEAAKLLGFPGGRPPEERAEVDRMYRRKCAPFLQELGLGSDGICSLFLG